MPWDKELQHAYYWEVEALLAFDSDVEMGTTYDTTELPPDDPILAKYEAPKLEGFEEQDALIRQFLTQKNDGTEPFVIDPARGLGLPQIPGGVDFGG